MEPCERKPLGTDENGTSNRKSFITDRLDASDRPSIIALGSERLGSSGDRHAHPIAPADTPAAPVYAQFSSVWGS